MSNSFRVIDANLNRACEGIRVLEDFLRFKFDNLVLTKEARNIRHSLRDTFKDIQKDLILARCSDSDIGVEISKVSKDDIKNKELEFIIANFKRCQEALRVIEENLKSNIVENSFYQKSKMVEENRFRIYSLEKKVLSFYDSRKKRVIPEGIYGITADKFSNGKSNAECVLEMAKAGIKVIQYREKYKSLKEKALELKEIRAITKDYGVCLIVNDNPDLAILCGADGVHIGQDDLDIEDVRKIVGEDMIIGLSTHSMEQAEDAVKRGADYIGVGPLFTTQTKDNVCAPVGLEYLDYVSKNIDIPFVAIGGIKLHNIDSVLEYNPKSICLVTEIVGAADIGDMVNKINNKINEKIKKGENNG